MGAGRSDFLRVPPAVFKKQQPLRLSRQKYNFAKSLINQDLSRLFQQKSRSNLPSDFPGETIVRSDFLLGGLGCEQNYFINSQCEKQVAEYLGQRFRKYYYNYTSIEPQTMLAGPASRQNLIPKNSQQNLLEAKPMNFKVIVHNPKVHEVDYAVFVSNKPQFRVHMLVEGHGIYRSQMSYFCSKILLQKIIEHALDKGVEFQSYIKEAFEQVNQIFRKHNPQLYKGTWLQFSSKLSGCSAGIIIQMGKRTALVNIGSMKIFLLHRDMKSERHALELLTNEHVPTDLQQKVRIYKHGGQIKSFDYQQVPRVMLMCRMVPGVEVSRSIGDQIAKTIGVIAEPEIRDFIPPADCALAICSKAASQYQEQLRKSLADMMDYEGGDLTNSVVQRLYNANVQYEGQCKSFGILVVK